MSAEQKARAFLENAVILSQIDLQDLGIKMGALEYHGNIWQMQIASPSITALNQFIAHIKQQGFRVTQQRLQDDQTHTTAQLTLERNTGA